MSVMKSASNQPFELFTIGFEDKMRRADGTQPPVTGMFMFGIMGMFFNKASQVEELFLTKNAFYTKHELERQGGKPLIGANISSLDTDHPMYKKKRKALSGAFFKSKMSQIAQTVKQVALETFAQLQAQGDENVVCINKFTSQVQANIIVSQLVGSKYCFRKLMHTDLETGKEEEITIGQFCDQLFPDLMTRM